MSVRVVTVLCTANLCRSPLAAVMLMAHLQRLEVRDVFVRSAGTHAFEGSSAVSESRRAAASRRLDLSAHRAQLLDGTMARTSDLLLCAASDHREFILSTWPDVPAERVRLFNEAVGDEAPLDVVDPYGHGQPVFERTAAVIDAAMAAWAERIAAGDPPPLE